MTYTEILTDAWNRADDTVRPYKWSDTDWISYLNNCLDELCIQTQFLVDSADTDLCYITVANGTASYALNSRIINVLDVWDNTTGTALYNYSVGQMPDGWRADTGTPTTYILDDTTGYITFYPTPDAAKIIRLRVSRLCKEPATSDTLDESPDIPVKYHRFLVDGILYQAYAKNDAETRDPEKLALCKRNWLEAINFIYQASKRHHMTERVISPQLGFM
jgi:hypothetical protein